MWRYGIPNLGTGAAIRCTGSCGCSRAWACEPPRRWQQRHPLRRMRSAFRTAARIAADDLADLVLMRGDPEEHMSGSHDTVAIWKGG